MRRLALFARWPEPGRVKTRLSPALPAPLACELHRAMIEDALAVAAATGAGERFLYWDRPGAEGEEALAAIPAGFVVRTQRGGDLGARLETAFAELLLEPGDRAVVAGSDCPGLAPALLDRAFEALAERDVALGEALDGGYWAIGLRVRAPRLFRDIAWGSPRVLEQTLAAASAAGLGVARLAPLADLDTPADLVRWIASRVSRAREQGEAEESFTPGAATDAALRRMKLLP